MLTVYASHKPEGLGIGHLVFAENQPVWILSLPYHRDDMTKCLGILCQEMVVWWGGFSFIRERRTGRGHIVLYIDVLYPFIQM